MHEGTPLYLPVILGTTRKGRLSENVARLVADVAAKQPGVTTELIDIAQLPLPADDAGEAIRDAGFAEKMERADGLVVVTPEYNHSFPGLLKHALDSCLEQYIHKPVGLIGVAAGPFGGARCIQSFLPVMRELGLVTIFSDVYFGSVHELFDDAGRLRDESYVRRTRDFLDELVWMATTLRWGRRRVGVEADGAEAEPLACEVCGAAMNHHANKPVDPRSPEQAAAGIVTLAAHRCPACGHGEARASLARA
ncbi:MAG: NAD(P)H-dependent oxidoreductase [Deltaproteobacteria bacterium]|nr:MAG: NAD(P)H-dependent oxidoreductase [Deltaproteobacteria bacterium]